MKVPTRLVLAAALLCAAQQVHAIDFATSGVDDTGAGSPATEDVVTQDDISTGTSSAATESLEELPEDPTADLTGVKGGDAAGGLDTLSLSGSAEGDVAGGVLPEPDVTGDTGSASCSEEFELAAESGDDEAGEASDCNEELEIADSDCNEELDIADSDCDEELDIADSDCDEELDIAGSDCDEELDIAGSDCDEELDIAGTEGDEPIDGGVEPVDGGAKETPETGGGGGTEETIETGGGEETIETGGGTEETVETGGGSSPVEAGDGGAASPIDGGATEVETPDVETGGDGGTPAGDEKEVFLQNTEPESDPTAEKGGDAGGDLMEDEGTGTSESATEPVESEEETNASPGGDDVVVKPAVEGLVDNETEDEKLTEVEELPSESEEGKEKSAGIGGGEEAPDVEEDLIESGEGEKPSPSLAVEGAEELPDATGGGAETSDPIDDSATKGQPPVATGGDEYADAPTPDASAGSSPDVLPGAGADTPPDLTIDVETGGDDDAGSDCTEELDIAGSDCTEELDIADSDCDEELDIAGSDCDEELDIAGSDCIEELDIAGSDCDEELDIAGQDDSSCSQEFSLAGSTGTDEQDLGSETLPDIGGEKGEGTETGSPASATGEEQEQEDSPGSGSVLTILPSGDDALVPDDTTATTSTGGSKDTENTVEQNALSAEAVSFKSSDDPKTASMSFTPFIAAGVACVALAIVGAVYMKRRSSRSKKAEGDIFTIDKNSAL